MKPRITLTPEEKAELERDLQMFSALMITFGILGILFLIAIAFL